MVRWHFFQAALTAFVLVSKFPCLDDTRLEGVCYHWPLLKAESEMRCWEQVLWLGGGPEGGKERGEWSREREGPTSWGACAVLQENMRNTRNAAWDCAPKGQEVGHFSARSYALAVSVALAITAPRSWAVPCTAEHALCFWGGLAVHKWRWDDLDGVLAACPDPWSQLQLWGRDTGQRQLLQIGSFFNLVNNFKMMIEGNTIN